MPMIACYFRPVDDAGKPTGYVGLVFAVTQKALFWEIDQFCDPYRVEINRASAAGGVCVKQNEDESFTEVELPDVPASGWEPAVWPDDITEGYV